MLNKKLRNEFLFQAVSVVLSYLTDERRRHSRILWVNLQEELILEGNGQMFTSREPGCWEQPVQVHVENPQQQEVLSVLTVSCEFFNTAALQFKYLNWPSSLALEFKKMVITRKLLETLKKYILLLF